MRDGRNVLNPMRLLLVCAQLAPTAVSRVRATVQSQCPPRSRNRCCGCVTGWGPSLGGGVGRYGSPGRNLRGIGCSWSDGGGWSNSVRGHCRRPRPWLPCTGSRGRGSLLAVGPERPEPDGVVAPVGVHHDVGGVRAWGGLCGGGTSPDDVVGHGVTWGTGSFTGRNVLNPRCWVPISAQQLVPVSVALTGTNWSQRLPRRPLRWVTGSPVGERVGTYGSPGCGTRSPGALRGSGGRWSRRGGSRCRRPRPSLGGG